jgi:hypothetical protein
MPSLHHQHLTALLPTQMLNHDSGSNSGTHHIHHDINVSRSSSNYHKDKNNLHDLAQKVTNNVKHKLNVGDIPFPWHSKLHYRRNGIEGIFIISFVVFSTGNILVRSLGIID